MEICRMPDQPRSGVRRRVRYVLGLMSGTSCDGIDAVWVEIHGRGDRMRVSAVGHYHRAYASALRLRLLEAMCPAETRTEELVRLHAEVGAAFAEAARKAVTRRGGKRPDLIASHGQTIGHLPGPRGATATLQIGDPARIAAAVGVPVIADFRAADVAAGGQGAPLVPWTDFVLFRDSKLARCVQNIGGIANVSYLPAGAAPEDVIAFDTGPGNMVIDGLVAHATNGRGRFDRDGRLAARGRVLEPVLRRWLRDPFFRRRPPKSAGREDFGRPFVTRELGRLKKASGRAEDWVATATALTARTIAEAYRRFLPRRGTSPAVDEVIACGGGAANATLLAMLAGELPHIAIRPIDAFGIGRQAKEALSFAMLGAAYDDGVPANLPQVTGARRAAVLGAKYLPPAGDP
jgi:anhydro-N-acetylmuramic acid kinase